MGLLFQPLTTLGVTVVNRENLRDNSWYGQREKMDSTTLGYLVLLGIGVCIMVPLYVQSVLEGRAFLAKTPLQHIEAAAIDLAQIKTNRVVQEDLIRDGLKHTGAVPNGSAHSDAAREIGKALIAIDAERKAALAAAQRQIDWKKEGAVRLQGTLKELGYDYSVELADAASDELTVRSTDFSDTDRRVHFLQILRNRNNEVCLLGFRTVRLKDGWFSFGESYSLVCN